MYKRYIRFLFALLCITLLCSAVQATNLQITVVDNLDNTSVSHATVFLGGSNLGRTTADGQFAITHSGLYDLNLRITMDGYDDWTQTVNRNATSLLVNLTRKTLALNVNLYDSDTLQPVTGATIDLTADNTTQTKQTDAYGSATFGVISSTLYSYDITAPNYQSRSGTVDIGYENQDVQLWLLSGNRYSFIVKDKDTQLPLADALVSIDSVPVGKTDSRGILIVPITRGKVVTLDIKKDGYQAISESKTISDTEALSTISLTKVPVGAFVFVSDENNAPLNGADVSINGTVVASTNPFGRASLQNLVAGSYQISVKKDGYTTTTRQIAVSKDSSDFSVVLPYEKVDLTIFVQDKDQKNLSNATLFMDGITIGITDVHGQFITPVKYATSYNISASKDGYQSASIETQVSLGNTTPLVTLTLEKNLDWGLIMLIALGVVGVLLLFIIIRIIGHRNRRRHVMKRNEI
ncbi:MAG: carboxypeptidase regulatory-like domain-containing protein [Methanoregula sp.]